jgi:hypothetical protein
LKQQFVKSIGLNFFKVFASASFGISVTKIKFSLKISASFFKKSLKRFIISVLTTSQLWHDLNESDIARHGRRIERTSGLAGGGTCVHFALFIFKP